MLENEAALALTIPMHEGPEPLAEDPITAVIYQDSMHLGGLAIADEIRALLEAERIPTRTVEVLRETESWEASGLRTVPAVELLVAGRPSQSWPGISNPLVVRDAIAAIRGERRLHLPERRVPRFRVTASTGCHRYRRWNEQSLGSRDDRMGWSSPSRTRPCAEALEFDLLRTWPLVGIGLRPRDWGQCLEYRLSFPDAFSVQTSLDRSSWTEAISVSGHRCESIEAQCWRWPLQPARFVRLHLRPTSARREAKFFSQIMGVEFWYKGDPGPLSPSFERLDVGLDAPDDQPLKRGLMWSPGREVELWRFDAGQGLPLRILPEAEVLWVVVEGELLVRWKAEEGREQSRWLRERDAVTLPPGLVSSISGPREGHARALAISSGGPREVWASRCP